MEQIKWFERKFEFSGTQNIFPSIVERLRGTPVRLRDKLSKITNDADVVKKIKGSWSIIENIGHLIDLEPLWQGRLDDILNGREELRPVDLENTKTDAANYNDKDIRVLIKAFSEVRSVTIAKLEALNEGDVYKMAIHPRLKTPMRMMDLFLFVAEHDDHHLARITEISRFIK